MKYENKVKEWIKNTQCEKMRTTLQKWLDENDEKSIQDAFFQELTFGTAGLRGTIGPGTNRMNTITVARATQGLANYLNNNFKNPSVAIARDSRNKGDIYVKTTASVLAANNILAHVFTKIEPTPALAYATQYLNCDAGICITASHNPKEYNGYKVFNERGCQITSEVAKNISNEISSLHYFEGIKKIDFEEGVEKGLIRWIDEECENSFVEKSIDGVPNIIKESIKKLNIVYTPLNGTGLSPITKAVNIIGIDDFQIVPEQKDPDGNFPTCPSPNPEEKDALELGLKLASKENADILLATDPDADRTGIAINHKGKMKLVTGNEVGIILMDHLASKFTEDEIKQKVFCTTLVSTSMADSIANEFGFELRRVPTGFKYIGEQITQLEQQGRRNDFVMGFEESYGYLVGTHVRDKDSVSTCVAICDAVATNKNNGKDLIDVLEELYEKYGYYKNSTQSYKFPGADGSEKMKQIMSDLRHNPPKDIAGKKVITFTDYLKPTNMTILNSRDGAKQLLPEINVLQFDCEDDTKLIIRPSGTEPKIKAYSFVKEKTDAQSLDLLNTFNECVDNIFNQ